MSEVTLERPPKILILGEAAAVHTRRWVDYFRQSGWTVRWLSFAPLMGEGVEEIPERAANRALSIWKNRDRVRTVIDDFRPDVISALFLPDYGWLATLAKRGPLAVSAWGSDVLLSPRRSPLHRWRIQHVLKTADWLFCDAEVLSTEMIRLGARRDRIRVVPMGIEESWLEIGVSRKTTPNSPCRVVTNRRLELLYRVDTFIAAVHELQHEMPNKHHFTVVGEGSARGDLEILARELGLHDRIEFTGHLPERDLQELLSKSDLYVSCSSSDGTSVSLLEAMASGVFPIVTDLPANREWLANGETGLLFPVGDHTALAAAIARATQSSELRDHARDPNRELVVRRARWSDNMTHVQSDMEQLIADNMQAQNRRRSGR